MQFALHFVNGVKKRKWSIDIMIYQLYPFSTHAIQSLVDIYFGLIL